MMRSIRKTTLWTDVSEKARYWTSSAAQAKIALKGLPEGGTCPHYLELTSICSNSWQGQQPYCLRDQPNDPHGKNHIEIIEMVLL